MKVALPICRGRVSPVLDVARTLRVIQVEHALVVGEMEHEVDGERSRALTALGVEVLICGALSLELESALGAAGIEVIAGHCGPADEVISAYVAGRLGEDCFTLPGFREAGPRSANTRRATARAGSATTARKASA